jgi:hypothetical protein
MKSIFIILMILASAAIKADAQILSLEVRPTGGEALIYEPVYVDIDPGLLNMHAPVCLESGGQTVPGQIEMTEEGIFRLWWPADVSPGNSRVYDLYDGKNCNPSGGFYWARAGDESTKLSYSGRPVIQYEHPVYDSANIEETKKPYHHVFDPAGNGLITKGVGGLYSHHRGIYFGYYLYTGEDRIEKAANDIDRIDIWHARNGERSEHRTILKEFSGPVMSGHVLEILWKDRDGTPLVREIRDIRVYKQPRGESVIDFKSHLTALRGPVKLAGDRQHAGVQFRAAQYVADHPENTRFIRPGHLMHLAPDSEIEGDDMYDLPWNAMHFTIEDRSYTTAYLAHPGNPDGAEMSERRYGRFGEYIPHDLTQDRPLTLQYRFWLTAGDAPSAEEIQRRYAGYSAEVEIQKTIH